MNLKIETLSTHAGYEPKETQYGPMNIPITLATAFHFGDAKTAAARFALQELGPIYSRLTNPTLDAFEARVAALENGVAAISASSGMAATFYAVANLANAGDNIIIAKKIYASNLLGNTFRRFGIEARLFDADNPNNLESLIDDKTKVIFFETLSNPQISISDHETIVQIANKYGIVTIADNTVATPILFRPLEHGIDVSLHSASKYMSGNGASIAGVLVSNKNLNKKLVGNIRYPYFNEPDSSYHGLIFASIAEYFDIFTLSIRVGLLRDIGATLSPFGAWQLINSIESLPIRIRAHSDNALKIAEWLEKQDAIKFVNYPGLKSSPMNPYIKKYFEDGKASGLLSFDVGDRAVAEKIVNATNIFAIVVNIGDTKSIITHPASTTHSQLSKSELDKIGITPGLIRLSVGLENASDLIEDLAQAFKKAGLK